MLVNVMSPLLVCAYGGVVDIFWYFRFICEFFSLYLDDVGLRVVYPISTTDNIKHCTQNSNFVHNTQHLHDETHILPIKEHLQLHASHIRQKSQHPTVPLQHNKQHPDTGNKQQHRYNTNPNNKNNAQIETNMKHIHTTIVDTYLNNRKHNKVTNTIPLNVYHSETTLPRATCRILAQLSTNKCPTLLSYLNKTNTHHHYIPPLLNRTIHDDTLV